MANNTEEMKDNPNGSNPKGRIAVYDANHRLWAQKLYYTSSGMKRIMSEWMAEFKHSPGSYITVRPYFDEDGNERTKESKVRLEVPQKQPEGFVRPPAVYSNNHSLYDK